MLRALSLWQPWASLMAVGAKKIETRSWSTDYRGWVAIHASKRFQELERDLVIHNIKFRESLYPHYKEEGAPSRGVGILKNLPLGAFVAVGRLVDCLSTGPSGSFLAKIPDESTDEFWFGDYSPRRFMWMFDEIHKLREPVYAPGKQSLWTIPDSALLDVIEDHLPEPYRLRVVAA